MVLMSEMSTPELSFLVFSPPEENCFLLLIKVDFSTVSHGVFLDCSVKIQIELDALVNVQLEGKRSLQVRVTGNLFPFPLFCWCLL